MTHFLSHTVLSQPAHYRFPWLSRRLSTQCPMHKLVTPTLRPPMTRRRSPSRRHRRFSISSEDLARTPC
eukprot:1180337-Pleurochrysis_carterae.AAC.1